VHPGSCFREPLSDLIVAIDVELARNLRRLDALVLREERGEPADRLQVDRIAAWSSNRSAGSVSR
jgi:hypothetical protein